MVLRDFGQAFILLFIGACYLLTLGNEFVFNNSVIEKYDVRKDIYLDIKDVIKEYYLPTEVGFFISDRIESDFENILRRAGYAIYFGVESEEKEGVIKLDCVLRGDKKGEIYYMVLTIDEVIYSRQYYFNKEERSLSSSGLAVNRNEERF